MLESLKQHCPEAHVHVLCLSEQCHAALSFLAYPFVSLIRLGDFEVAEPELAAVRATRSLVEYYFTITPCLPWHLLSKKKLPEVTYLDADMMFFASPQPIFDEADDASVILTPHRFSDNLKDREVYGKYNVSWLTFRNSEQGLACLAWYRQACLDWCYDRLEAGRFADQKYLDVFPEKFSGVYIMRHLGGGVAPWNISQADIACSNNRVTVSQQPLIFYHAHGVKRIWGPFFFSGLSHYETHVRPVLRRCIFTPYLKAFTRCERRVKSIYAGQGDGILRKNNEAVSSGVVRDVYGAMRNKNLLFCF